MSRGVIRCFSLLLPIFLLGCEEDLNLRANYPAPFTLYGVISPDLDTQSVRIYPLDNFPRLGLNLPHGISLTSHDLETGELVVWQDTILTKPNGQQDLAFWASLQIHYGRSYRIEATRQSDNATSYAVVNIPEPVEIRFEEIESPAVNEMDIKVTITGEATRILKPEIVYKVKGSGAGSRERDTLLITRLYHRREVKKANSWEFVINMYPDRFWVQGEYNAITGSRLGILCQVLDLKRMDLHVIIGDSLWDPPNGSFDPNLLSHQNALNNVTNGLGFIGGGYKIVKSIEPSRQAVEKACFTYAF